MGEGIGSEGPCHYIRQSLIIQGPGRDAVLRIRFSVADALHRVPTKLALGISTVLQEPLATAAPLTLIPLYNTLRNANRSVFSEEESRVSRIRLKNSTVSSRVSKRPSCR